LHGGNGGGPQVVGPEPVIGTGTPPVGAPPVGAPPVGAPPPPATGAADVENSYVHGCAAQVAIPANWFPVPSVKAPSSINTKYVVEKLRSAVGLSVTVFSETVTSPPLAVLVCKVNVCTGVAQLTAPVQSLMNLLATSTTGSLNFKTIFRVDKNVVIPFGGSEVATFKVGATVSVPVVKLQNVVELTAANGLGVAALSTIAPAEIKT
jgi:hypothetical protein